MALRHTPYRPAHIKRRQGNGRLYPTLVIVFLVFSLLTLLAWCLPLRPTVSEEEQRTLTPFPELRISTLLDGSFFDGINLWFSDTFPLRQRWISLADRVEALHGRSEIMIYGDLTRGDDIPLPAPTEGTQDLPTEQGQEPAPGDAALAVPPTEPTEPATQAPAPEEPSQTAGEPETPTEPEPEAPTEDPAEQQNTVTLDDEDYLATGSVIQVNDAAYTIPNFNERMAQFLAESMSKAADAVEDKAGLYLILVPSNITFSLSRADREFMGLTLQEDGLVYQESILDPRVHFIRIYDKLWEHHNEYLAFRTDHHWTARAAYYAYEAWCEEKGVEPVPLSAYEEVTTEGFYGTTYSKARRSSLLKADTVYAYQPPGNVHLFIGSEDTWGLEYPLLADESRAKASIRYSTFLRGDQAKCLLVNDDITDDSTCLILKNSLGNPLAYYFTQHYQYTYVIDVRYYTNRRLSSFVSRFDVQDVIVCVGTDFGWGQYGNENLARFCR